MSHTREHLFINGEFVTPGGETRTVYEAATAQPLGTIRLATEADVDAAAQAAHAALPAWKALSFEERAAILNRFADALEKRAADTAVLCSRENGMPLIISEVMNGASPAGLVRLYLDYASRVDFEDVRPSLSGHTIVRRVPMGVVAAISPWNFPQGLAMMKIAPALATGNTVVFKAAPETTLDALVYADAAAEAGLPAGVLNVISGGRVPTQHLVKHPLVDKVAFTGSTEVGRSIAEACAPLFRPVTLELGGKSAGIVLPDADISQFANTLFETSFFNNGQTCYASTRILAPASRYDEVVETAAAVAQSLTVGDPTERDTLIGPMVTQERQKAVLGYIEQGKSSSARLVTGGGAVSDFDGWFVQPTVFADVDNADVIAQEEIFGPVLSIIKYETEDDAVRLANDSQYGLGGAIWSADAEHATEVARRIETGTIGINFYQLDLGSPFGGMKDSGLGRELGPEALSNYLQYQTIFRNTPVA